MGKYSIHAYGIDVSHVIGDMPWEYRDAIEENGWGDSAYDGGGYGQITYVGAEVPFSRKGCIVTPEVEEQARKAYQGLSEEIRLAICAALAKVGQDCDGQRWSDEAKARLAQGILPEPEFLVMSGWG